MRNFTLFMACAYLIQSASCFLTYTKTLKIVRSNNIEVSRQHIDVKQFKRETTLFSAIERDVKVEKPVKRKSSNQDQQDILLSIHSADQFLDAIENAPQNGLVIVQFHAKWCKVCARVMIKLRQLAQRMERRGTSVPLSFITVEITANEIIRSTLGIKKFPFVQMYRNAECVASFGTGPAHNFQKSVGGTLDDKLAMTEEEWEKFRSDFKNEIAEGVGYFETLRLPQFYKSGSGITTDEKSLTGVVEGMLLAPEDDTENGLTP